MTDDIEYLKNYKSGHIYVNPHKDVGAYVSIAEDGETVLDEIEVGDRYRLTVTAFFKRSENDFNVYRLRKFRFRQRDGWQMVEQVCLNGFQLAHIARLNSLISALDLSSPTKSRLDLGQISISNLEDILNSHSVREIAEQFSKSPVLTQDIFALENKKQAVEEFERLLTSDCPEATWQSFLERNKWIFGFGLNYLFLDKAGDKFESITTGADFQTAGKRADGLAISRAFIDQFVLLEIKKATTPLLHHNEYRKGVWGVSSEVSNAVSQTQKTLYEFSNRYKNSVKMKDHEGYDTGENVFSVQPRSYLVVGSLNELAGNDDKISCFELYRRNLSSPEIITFDELFYRARNLLTGLSKTSAASETANDDLPF